MEKLEHLALMLNRRTKGKKYNYPVTEVENEYIQNIIFI